MQPTMLTVTGVHTFYGAIEALKGIDIEIGAGEIVSLIGANGAGKSTLLMTICGSPRARQGRVIFEGEDITDLPTHEIVRRGIAQSPEGRRIFPRMSVLENLQMGSIVAKPGSFDSELERVLTLFPRLKERIGQRAGTMSGGEQQMLAIGRALMSQPRLLLLDEPSLGLAPLIVKQIFQVIKEINRDRKMTVFMVEQNAFHALKLAHRGYVMVNGKITMTGTGAALLADPEVRAAYLEGGIEMETILGSSPLVFVFLTLLVFGGFGVLTGQTLAEGWKPASSAMAYSLLLGVGDRFLAWGIFGEQLLSVYGFIVHTLVIGAITLAAHRIAIARRMVNQYPWLYERAGPFQWRERVGAGLGE